MDGLLTGSERFLGTGSGVIAAHADAGRRPLPRRAVLNEETKPNCRRDKFSDCGDSADSAGGARSYFQPQIVIRLWS